jgi:hypothetical protein
MEMRMLPMNGIKTHPLSAHALAELRDIAAAPVPRCAVNPGVANRLEREGLVRGVEIKSPYKAHKGGTCLHLEITDAGRERL